jgi:hypothetical protein
VASIAAFAGQVPSEFRRGTMCYDVNGQLCIPADDLCRNLMLSLLGMRIDLLMYSIRLLHAFLLLHNRTLFLCFANV